MTFIEWWFISFVATIVMCVLGSMYFNPLRRVFIKFIFGKTKIFDAKWVTKETIKANEPNFTDNAVMIKSIVMTINNACKAGKSSVKIGTAGTWNVDYAIERLEARGYRILVLDDGIVVSWGDSE